MDQGLVFLIIVINNMKKKETLINKILLPTVLYLPGTQSSFHWSPKKALQGSKTESDFVLAASKS